MPAPAHYRSGGYPTSSPQGPGRPSRDGRPDLRSLDALANVERDGDAEPRLRIDHGRRSIAVVAVARSDVEAAAVPIAVAAPPMMLMPIAVAPFVAFLSGSRCGCARQRKDAERQHEAAKLRGSYRSQGIAPCGSDLGLGKWA